MEECHRVEKWEYRNRYFIHNVCGKYRKSPYSFTIDVSVWQVWCVIFEKQMYAVREWYKRGNVWWGGFICQSSAEHAVCLPSTWLNWIFDTFIAVIRLSAFEFVSFSFSFFIFQMKFKALLYYDGIVTSKVWREAGRRYYIASIIYPPTHTHTHTHNLIWTANSSLSVVIFYFLLFLVRSHGFSRRLYTNIS